MTLCWMDWDEIFKWAQREESHSVRQVVATYKLISAASAAWWRYTRELAEVWAAGIFWSEK